MDSDMREPRSIQDVVIIGGGPAGSTAATLLADKNHRVVVLEKERFPREHVGESLLPFCYDIFKRLGVLGKLTQRCMRKPGVRFIDVNGSHHTTWCFARVIKDPSYLSFHVRRGEFDQILLKNAQNHGAKVREQTRAIDVSLDNPDGIVTLDAVDPEGKRRRYHARFLLDASGRDTFLGRRLKVKKPNRDLDRSALSTHWVGGKFVEGIEEGLLQIVYLGDDKKGWIWVIPIGENRLSVGVVLNHSYIREQKEKLSEKGVDDWKMALYLQELESSKFVRDILFKAHIAQPLMFNGNYSYFIEKKYGSCFAMIGDASTFIDPIFASGVYLSMKSASLVSGAIHRKLTLPEAESADGLAHAYRQIDGAYHLVDRAIRLFYNPVAINFAQVGSAAPVIHRQHENALALGHYLLAGDFFEDHEKYNEFPDLLQDTRMLAKYKNYVIDREELQANSCSAEHSEIFNLMVADEKGQRLVY